MSRKTLILEICHGGYRAGISSHGAVCRMPPRSVTNYDVHKVVGTISVIIVRQPGINKIFICVIYYVHLNLVAEAFHRNVYKESTVPISLINNLPRLIQQHYLDITLMVLICYI